ncbi:hypothetical protein Gotri_027563 [Gossypium trilobum]|uniref:Cupin type-1 domain-containing protein n=1 Tax=Gossypium trilobum TaxID=34281 RepID=A0A7J9FMM7_9ROSI|nr:hypothetical protein [Gossypium trilobum]
MADFPALNGQSVSYAVLQYLAGSANPPHTDTPAAELLLLTYCIIEVGFVDTTNKLFTQRLQADSIFVLPKSLVHCQFIWAENDSRIVVVCGSRVTSDIMLIDGLIKKGGVMVGQYHG